jgi:hypothetical protein
MAHQEAGERRRAHGCFDADRLVRGEHLEWPADLVEGVKYQGQPGEQSFPLSEVALPSGSDTGDSLQAFELINGAVETLVCAGAEADSGR